MKKIVVLLIAIAMCLVGCTANKTDGFVEPNSKVTENVGPNLEVTDNVEPVVKDEITSNVSDDTVSNITSDDPLDALEDVIEKDVESTIDGLDVEWKALKSKIDTYDKYSKNIGEVEAFYDKINVETEQLCKRLCEYALQYAKLIMASDKSFGEKYDDFDELYDCIYDDASDEIYDEIYDGILEDMYDSFYDGVIDDAYDTIKYAVWSDVHSNEYDWYSDTRSDVYDLYSDTRSDIYDFYSDVRRDLWDKDIDDVEDRIKDFEEDIK